MKNIVEHTEQVGNKKVKMWHDKINFMRYRMPAYVISILFIVVAMACIFIKGFNWGLDFTGGTALEITSNSVIATDHIRDVLQENKYEGVLVQTTGSAKDVMVRIPAKDGVKNDKVSNEVIEILKNLDPKLKLTNSSFIGPTTGAKLTEDAVWAVTITLLMIMAYIGFRFEWRLGTGALLSLAHDVVVVLGIYSFLHIEMESTFIAAVLSVVGYSLNDSIVVFDRVRENFRKYDHVSSADIIDISLTQTLARTLITTVSTLLVVGALLIFGGASLYSFSLALFVGILFGAYSSIYVAVAIAYDLGIKREHVLIKEVIKEGADQTSLM